MTQVKHNIVANYAGSFWATLMSLIFIPVYIKFLGVELIGLVGFFASLQAMLMLLDMGLRTTLTHEIASLSGHEGKEQQAQDLVRTLEVVYWAVALAIGAAVILLSFPIAHYWINPDKLSVDDVRHAVMFMGLIMLLRWPFSLYAGGLNGLQRQVLLNEITAGMATVRGVGAVAVLWLVSPTIQAFFCWQLVASALQTILGAYYLRRSLPLADDRPRFRKHLLLGVWRFAAGIAGMNILATTLTHIDKIILSKMLSLDIFGYYSLAWAVAGSALGLAFPICNAVFPRFSQLISLSNRGELKELYHKSAQVLAVAILPAASILAFFSYYIIWVWTRDPVIAEKTSPALTMLAIGVALSGMLQLSSRLQLAHKWTSLLIWTQVAFLAMMPPLLIWLLPRYGILGGAGVWSFVNVVGFCSVTYLMHRRILLGEMRPYFLVDVGLPFVGAVAAACMGWAFMPGDASMVVAALLIGATSAAAILAAALAAPCVRQYVLYQWRNFLAVLGYDQWRGEEIRRGESCIRPSVGITRGPCMTGEEGDHKDRPYENGLRPLVTPNRR